MLRKIGWTLLISLLLIQFFRPERNLSAGPQPNDISSKYPPAPEVKALIERACFDCHSNNTRYPWYANIQPVAWWLNGHVQEGKEELNFSEFLSYSPRKAHHKMEELNEMVHDGIMPLKSYTLIHRDAVLNEKEKAALISWSKEVMKDLESRHPEVLQKTSLLK